MKFAFDFPVGAHCLDGGGCRFSVWAPCAEAVSVETVAPEQRRFRLQAEEGGYHRGYVEEAGPGTRYFLRLYKQAEEGTVRSERWPDPASRSQPEGVHGPSEAVSGGFSWSVPHWWGIPLSRYVICEIHVGTFSAEGTFEGVGKQLDRLKKTGFTAVELMPVNPFPGRRNWGYDGVYPFAVHEAYGGPEGLKRLVDACHAKGLAVILDVVYNHLGPEGNYFRQFGPYFTDFYRTPWGEAVNFDGPGSDPVRRFFIENALQWFCEFRIDALRLDAVHAIYDHSARPFLEELGAAVRGAAERENRRMYCIAESALNDARLVRGRASGGFGLDAQWNDDFHHALHTLLTGEERGYYRDFGRIEDLAKAWREGFVYSGQYSPFRGRSHGSSSRSVPGRRLVVFSQNHDQVGNRMNGSRLATLVSFEQLKLAAAAVLLSPFVPLLFMGEAYGETAPFPYFVSHSDPDLVEAVRKGRRREFRDFHRQGDPPDPQSESTFRSARIDPSLARTEPHRSLLAFHRELIRLRKETCSLARPGKKAMRVSPVAGGRILCVHRWSPRDQVFALFCFDERPGTTAAPVPPGRWRRVLDSAAERWRGGGSALPDVLRGRENETVDLEPSPYSAAVYTAAPSMRGE